MFEHLPKHIKKNVKLDAGHLYPPSEVMILDDQTIMDLEIFESEEDETTLYSLCNNTRNQNGAIALRIRMENPWSTSERIIAVQESIKTIIKHRPIFDNLPIFVITEIIERYFHGGLPLVMSANPFEFFVGVMEMRYGDYARFSLIMRGVQSTSTFLHKLRLIAFAKELQSASGELGDILTEMRSLLSLDDLKNISEEKAWNLSAWQVLRTDQVFRIHQKQYIARLLQLNYELDALISMADTTKKHHFVMPQVKDGPLFMHAEDVVHPLVENSVANPLDLNQQSRLLFLTGPNMAGKTTYLRACAIALYFAHLGMGVPAGSFSFAPAQRLFSSITLADNLRNGISYFRAEGLRVKAIAQALAEGYRVIALMDEPFKGTNVKDALDASRAIMERFATKQNSLFMFSSHLIELSDQMKAIDQVDCRYFEAREHEGRLRFEYILQEGVSSQRLGMRVLEEEGIFELLDGVKTASTG